MSFMSHTVKVVLGRTGVDMNYRNNLIRQSLKKSYIRRRMTFKGDESIHVGCFATAIYIKQTGIPQNKGRLEEAFSLYP